LSANVLPPSSNQGKRIYLIYLLELSSVKVCGVYADRQRISLQGAVLTSEALKGRSVLKC
jgi:hypothetical protein